MYQYTVPNGGYAANGDLLQYADSVMGAWSFGYNGLDRLVTATGAAQNQNLCWAYDMFGNRLAQASSDVAFASSDGTCTTTGTLYQNVWASYNESDQITQTNAQGSVITNTPQTPIYDDAGDVIDDGRNQYLYDAEGRVCGVSSGAGAKIGYVYDAEGNRVAKGVITSWSCDPTQNGFRQMAGYVVGPSGEQLTETDGNGNWSHTNVWAGGRLIGTYDGKMHYYLTDPLGTRRVQTNAAGIVEATYQSLPYGDGFGETAQAGSDDPTENHFTGKERDS